MRNLLLRINIALEAIRLYVSSGGGVFNKFLDAKNMYLFKHKTIVSVSKYSLLASVQRVFCPCHLLKQLANCEARMSSSTFFKACTAMRVVENMTTLHYNFTRVKVAWRLIAIVERVNLLLMENVLGFVCPVYCNVEER